MSNLPTGLTQFRLEPQDNGLVHLVFDCPDRSMNVFSNKAIHELGKVAEWLHGADIGGLLIRSGKDTGFCAGADLTELGVAYDMIVDAPQSDRFDIAFDHFFPLSHAIRRLESAGTPVAAALGGVALGGGCELSLGAHYRVLADHPRAMLGLPESQVGLLPGAGGTQRMPRLIGVECGLQVLLQGCTYSGEAALKAGLVDALVAPGEETAAAEAWLLSGAAIAIQPWDREDYRPLRHSEFAKSIEAHRTRELERTLGHEPAPLAIIECVELGLMQPMDGAIRSEMSVFARLIQRPEPRNMIRTLFLGKQAYDKASRTNSVSKAVEKAGKSIGAAIEAALEKEPALRLALFGDAGVGTSMIRDEFSRRMWLLEQDDLCFALQSACGKAQSAIVSFDEGEVLQLDYLLTSRYGVPSYLGGASGLAKIDRSPSSGPG